MELKTYRTNMGWTLEEAAAFASFSNGSTWARYERGERYPAPAAMETIMRLSGGKVTPEDMLTTRRAWERARDAERKRSAMAETNALTQGETTNV